jgi:hypothetical protein
MAHLHFLWPSFVTTCEVDEPLHFFLIIPDVFPLVWMTHAEVSGIQLPLLLLYTDFTHV